MSKTAGSIAEAIERFYGSFVLRDLFGFVLPGAVFLLSLLYLVLGPEKIPVCSGIKGDLECLQKVLNTERKTIQIIAFLGFSYSTAWVLQSVHYGLIDWIFQIVRSDKKWRSVFWPVTGIGFYAKAIARFENQGDETEATLPSLITRGALSPDKVSQRIKGKATPERVRESAIYTERASALMLMTGNLAIASIPFFLVLALKSSPLWLLVGFFVVLFVYLEHWRLWYARNLRHSIFVAAAIDDLSGSE